MSQDIVRLKPRIWPLLYQVYLPHLLDATRLTFQEWQSGRAGPGIAQASWRISGHPTSTLSKKKGVSGA